MLDYILSVSWLSSFWGTVQPDLQARAQQRVEKLHAEGVEDAYLYGVPDSPGATGGIESLNAFFLLLDKPEVYNLPQAPTLPQSRTPKGLVTGMVTMALLGVAAAATFFLGRDGH